jgi:periplasmic protein TonB
MLLMYNKILSYGMYCILYFVGFERRIMSALAIEGCQTGIRQDPLSCWWEIPNKNITVVLDMQVIERINEEISSAALQGVSNKEIGGLLFGTIAFDPTLQVIATECFPIPCGHKLGPSHQLSFADRRQLRKKISRYKKTQGALQYFVSYYRSNLGPDMQLTSSDLALARDFVPDLFFFLLIQPLYPINIGGLFFSGEEPAQPESRILFPFDKTRLLAGDRILTDFPKDTTSASPTIAVGAISQESPLGEISGKESYSVADFAPSSFLRSLSAQQYERKSLRKTWLWISLGGFLVLALIGILYMSMRSKVAVAPRPEMEIAEDLGLKAKVEQNQLYVKWNKTFPGVQSAKKGILSMQNGAFTQTKSLSSRELLRGDIVLPYSGAQVSVQLFLVLDESNVISPVATEANAPSTLNSEALTETINIPSRKLADEGRPQPQNPVVSALPKPASALQPPPLVVAAQIRPLPKETAKINNAAIRPAQASTVGVAQSLISQPISVAPESKLKPQSAAAAESPSQNQPSPQPKEAPVTRSLQISTFPPATSLESNSGANASTPESKPAPVVAGSADSVPTSVPSAKPKENLESPDAFIPPRPIEAPNSIILPSSLRSQMPESRQVDIRVYVDATGAVIGAKSLYDNAQISRLAVDVVRRMRFTPARRGNQNIASDLILKLKLITDEPR